MSDVAIFVVPLATIIVFIVFSIIGLLLWLRQRRRNRSNQQGPVMFPNTVFVPPQNFVLPMQPTNSPSVPMTQPTPYPNTQSRTSTPNTNTQPTPYPSTQIPHSMPVLQPLRPTPTFPNPSPQPDPTTPDLIDRMQQVQKMMVEIHRLENGPGERNSQRVQELKKRVIELSNINGQDSLDVSDDDTSNSRQPPPYLPRDNDSQIRGHDDGRG